MSIRDQSYKNYEGTLGAGSPLWWVVATHSLRLHWHFVRSKLLLFPIYFVFILFILATFGERMLAKTFGGGLGADPEAISGFYEYALGYLQVWVVALYFASSGGGVVAEDLRYRTIQLYFSKPLGKTDYIIGKFASLFMLGSIVTLIPTLLVVLVRMLVFVPSPSFSDVALKLAAVVGYDIVMLAVMCLMMMALSSLTPRTGYVVLAWAGLMLIPSVVSTVVGLVRTGEEWPGLLSVAGSLGLGLKTLVGYEGFAQPGQLAAEALPEYMTWAPWCVVLALAAGAVGILYWRTSKLEGIA